MFIKKFKNGNFHLKWDKNHDTNDRGILFKSLDMNALQKFNNLTVLICNSSEMDFILEDCPDGRTYMMYNANTMKYYWLAYTDVLAFFNGRTIKLEPIKGNYKEYEEYFKSIFDDEEAI